MAFLLCLKFTVPSFFFIFLFGSNFLEVPKSITLRFAFYLFESNNKFSGFRSLLEIYKSQNKKTKKKNDQNCEICLIVLKNIKIGNYYIS